MGRGMGGVVTPSAASPPEGRVPRKKGDSGEALPSDIPGWPLCGDSGLVWAPGGHCPMLWWGNGLQGAPLCPGHPGSQGSRLGQPGTPGAVGAMGGDRGTQSQGKGCFLLREALLPCV